VKRGGGWVKCCSASTPFLAGVSPTFIDRQAPRESSSRLRRRGLFVEREEAREEHDLAGGAQRDLARSAPPASMSTVVRSISALAIWLASVRFQISS
jgi:hypothetical protein